MKKIAAVLLAAGLVASTMMADTSGGGNNENNTSVGTIAGAVGALLVVGVAIAASNDSANTTPSHTTTHQ